MKTAREILDEISPMMEKNKISGFSSFADDECLATQIHGYHDDILSALSMLIQDMVNNIGESDTIAAVMVGFRRQNVDMDSVISAAVFTKLHGIETDEEDEQ